MPFRRNPEAIRFQIALPSQINLGGLAAQLLRPVRSRCVYCPAAVAAELARQPQQHRSFFIVLDGLPGLIHKGAPAMVRNMLADPDHGYCD
jgi:hypothetical protein